MFRVLLADTDRENIKTLRKLLREHGLILDNWRSGHNYQTFLETAENAVVFVRIDNPAVPGLELTQAAVVRGPSIHVVWMAKSDAYALDAFRYGAEAYLLLPTNGEAFREIMHSLRIKSGVTSIYTERRDKIGN